MRVVPDGRDGIEAVRDTYTDYMFLHDTSRPQLRLTLPPHLDRGVARSLLDGLRKAVREGGGIHATGVAALPSVNKTRLVIVAVLKEVGRPVTSREVQRRGEISKSLSVVEYHLEVLVKAGIAELVVDRDELRFRLKRGGRPGEVFRERRR